MNLTDLSLTTLSVSNLIHLLIPSLLLLLHHQILLQHFSDLVLITIICLTRKTSRPDTPHCLLGPLTFPRPLLFGSDDILAVFNELGDIFYYDAILAVNDEDGAEVVGDVGFAVPFINTKFRNLTLTRLLHLKYIRVYSLQLAPLQIIHPHLVPLHHKNIQKVVID